MPTADQLFSPDRQGSVFAPCAQDAPSTPDRIPESKDEIAEGLALKGTLIKAKKCK